MTTAVGVVVGFLPRVVAAVAVRLGGGALASALRGVVRKISQRGGEAGSRARHMSLDSLFVAFATVGIGIGLRLQKIAETSISGLLILLARPIKVGDRVHVGGLEPTGVEIQSRGTVAQTKKNRRAAMRPAIDLLLRTR